MLFFGTTCGLRLPLRGKIVLAVFDPERQAFVPMASKDAAVFSASDIPRP
jgi:hypothetical protein